MSATQAWIRALTYTKGATNTTLTSLIDELAETFEARPALLSSTGSMTYKELAQNVNRCAHWAMAQGLGRGDVVCLMMLNHIDYVAIWLGLTRIGCTVALLNTNLRGDALLHCIQVAGSDAMISSGISPETIPSVARHWDWDSCGALHDGPHDERLLANVPPPRPDDRALLIYTSGTTGLPKATVITHRRIIEWSFWFAGMMDTQTSDRLYNCLPMYHSVGGVVAVGSMLVKGGSVFIRERFSASQFWDDVSAQDCTIFQYIGELCRYLTLAAPHPQERSHRLRLACGNGLQSDVWCQFQERFAIPQILEFYAATEGNLSLYNCEGKPGAVGRIPPFLARQFSAAIIQCDPETGVPVRNADGFCIQCADDEAGEAISQIKGRQFDGYTDPVASQKKILHDVFTKGDRWFRSGDLMRKDVGNYFFFVDRLGDTFRWKGENVSTTEVAAVLRGCAGVLDVAVYGVAVPGNEGRAGMAAMSTCKLTKTDLARQGFMTASDPVWRRDSKTGEFQRHCPRASDSPL
jgi:fatty-acyl-CoA synthase